MVRVALWALSSAACSGHHVLSIQQPRGAVTSALLHQESLSEPSFLIELLVLWNSDTLPPSPLSPTSPRLSWGARCELCDCSPHCRGSCLSPEEGGPQVTHVFITIQVPQCRNAGFCRWSNLSPAHAQVSMKGGQGFSAVSYLSPSLGSREAGLLQVPLPFSASI